MRSEAEMLKLILTTASADERIRAVLLNGSRANPRVEADCLQDYDIVYAVEDVADFLRTPDWIKGFGEILILQTPDTMLQAKDVSPHHFCYLMQFTDGTRIDLTLAEQTWLKEGPLDSLTVTLLDKDQLFQGLPEPCEADYLPKPPTAREFAECCNEFWWVSPYVAKGLWRRQLPYARVHLDTVLRRQLLQMAGWYIAYHHEWQVNPGHCGKHLEKWLPAELWQLWRLSYADADYDSSWRALFAMGRLFVTMSSHVADAGGFALPIDTDALTEFLYRIREMPHPLLSPEE